MLSHEAISIAKEKQNKLKETVYLYFKWRMFLLIWLKDPFADHGFLAPGIPEPLAPEALVGHEVNFKLDKLRI